MTAFVLGLPEHKVRVVAPDVGGGFGSKIYLYAEDVVVTWAAKQLNRPVKWTSDRSEAFLSDAHGRDHVTVAELALDKDGKFLAMRVKTTANLGAYLSTFASCIPTILYATLLAGQYTTPQIYCEVTAVFTNTTPVDAYRGAGRPEATYVVERLVETAARELKIDPVEIRRRNFIREFPYQTPVALQYDTGDYDATLDAALQLGDVSGFRQAKRRILQKRQAARHRLRRYIEACGIAPSNVAGSARRARRACSRRARSACIPPARSRYSPARTRTARATRPPSRRSSPTGSACRSRSGRDRRTATPRRSCSAWAPTARARSRSAARRS